MVATQAQKPDISRSKSQAEALKEQLTVLDTKRDHLLKNRPSVRLGAPPAHLTSAQRRPNDAAALCTGEVANESAPTPVRRGRSAACRRSSR